MKQSPSLPYVSPISPKCHFGRTCANVTFFYLWTLTDGLTADTITKPSATPPCNIHFPQCLPSANCTQSAAWASCFPKWNIYFASTSWYLWISLSHVWSSLQLAVPIDHVWVLHKPSVLAMQQDKLIQLSFFNKTNSVTVCNLCSIFNVLSSRYLRRMRQPALFCPMSVWNMQVLFGLRKQQLHKLHYGESI